MVGNICKIVTLVHIPPFVCLVLVPGNAIGDEGATALAGALGQLKQLTYFWIGGTCVFRWCALVMSSGMQVSLVLIVFGLGV